MSVNLYLHFQIIIIQQQNDVRKNSLLCVNIKKVGQTKQLSIRKTKGEWELINQVVADSGKDCLTDYIRCEVNRLKKQFDECPECITRAKGRKIEKRPYLPDTVYSNLTAIAKQMQIPESSVVDKLIIQPLLNKGFTSD